MIIKKEGVIEFGKWLTGHDQETVEKLFEDFNNYKERDSSQLEPPVMQKQVEYFAVVLWDKLLNWIKDDIEFGYTSSMIYNKIISNNYDITHTEEMKHLQKP